MSEAEALRYYRIHDRIYGEPVGELLRLAVLLAAPFVAGVFAAAVAAWIRGLRTGAGLFAVCMQGAAFVSAGILAWFFLLGIWDGGEEWLCRCVRIFLFDGRRAPPRFNGAAWIGDAAGEDDAEKSGADGKEHGEGNAAGEEPEAAQVVAAGHGDAVHDEPEVDVSVAIFVDYQEAACGELQGRLLLRMADVERLGGVRRLLEEGFVVLVHAAESSTGGDSVSPRATHGAAQN